MSRLFISHCTKDREKVRPFSDLLVLGMGIDQDDIFCTLESGTFSAGENFINKIKQQLRDCEKVICLITPDYLKSTFCLVELGAAWLQVGKIIPILVKPLNYSDLEGTPLSGTQALILDSAKDLFELYDELCNGNIAKPGRTAELSNRISNFIGMLERSATLLPDSEGFYTAKIEQIRSTPHSYKCYKIEGVLNLKGTANTDETHWIFFKAGMYPDLSVGDTIRFSVDYTELRDFPDIKNARNIYPKLLRVQKKETKGTEQI